MIIGVIVRLLSNSRLNRKVSWLPPRLQRKLRVPSIQGVSVLSLILSEPHAVLVTSHLAFIIINLLPDYGSLVHGWNHIQNPTIEKNDKVISDHKVSNVCKECTFYTKDCNTDRCLSVCACGAASMSDCLRPHGLQPTRSSVHGILQARILEWVAIPSSRGSSQPRDQTQVSYVSCTGKRILYHQHHLGSLSVQANFIAEQVKLGGDPCASFFLTQQEGSTVICRMNQLSMPQR